MSIRLKLLSYATYFLSHLEESPICNELNYLLKLGTNTYCSHLFIYFFFISIDFYTKAIYIIIVFMLQGAFSS